MNQARRKAIDDFLNPVPASASRMLENEGLDQDDGDHMESFFRKRDIVAEPVMNKRKIMPEIEMTGEAYQAKRVTREELEN